LSGNCSECGVVIPVSDYWYKQILPRLEEMGISFTEQIEICD